MSDGVAMHFATCSQAPAYFAAGRICVVGCVKKQAAVLVCVVSNQAPLLPTASLGLLGSLSRLGVQAFSILHRLAAVHSGIARKWSIGKGQENGPQEI